MTLSKASHPPCFCRVTCNHVLGIPPASIRMWKHILHVIEQHVGQSGGEVSLSECSLTDRLRRHFLYQRNCRWRCDSTRFQIPILKWTMRGISVKDAGQIASQSRSLHAEPPTVTWTPLAPTRPSATQRVHSGVNPTK